jgi:hypothetical protein
MSEDQRFEQQVEGKDESDDVEAHKKSYMRKAEATDEPGNEESDDVEAHHKKTL